ncbi:MAG TPA: glycerol-3-phosphate dehydrogenase [Geminicoccaceae bacterium]|nr:glycerol-3-phosphate dehydrogenase [Geminicoccaceae bacterium]
MAVDQPVDLLVVGGGVNGAGIARDAAGRGLKVLLCEQDDLAQHTSSASSKLIHGGLRYLEHYEFRLVREALAEREVLLRLAPHIIWPLRFVLPHSPEQRPAWMIRLGLFLYDHLGGREKLPGSARIDLARDPLGAPLKEQFRTGFTYADCWVDDARLVVLNAMDAAERGAEVLTRTRCAAARRADQHWQVTLQPRDGAARAVQARALVNASGPWVSRLLTEQLGRPALKKVRLVKGAHIVVPKLYDHASPYILQHTDGRVVFVIPYEQDFSLIGTTDSDYRGDPAAVAVTDDEIAYLCAATSRYLKRPVTPDLVRFAYAGVRPLYDDASGDVSAATRDYAFDLDDSGAPLLSVYGGKITTYRRLAEHALAKLQPRLGFAPQTWTHAQPLPGGDMPGGDFEAFLAALIARHPWLPPALARRYARAYGSRSERLLDGAAALDDLGEHLGDGLYAAEVDYLRRHEWAVTDDDILWRRSKLALHIGDATRARLRARLDGRAPMREVARRGAS